MDNRSIQIQNNQQTVPDCHLNGAQSQHRSADGSPLQSATDPQRPRVTLMIPCLNEEESLTHVIPQFINELSDDPDYDFEFLFLDDGSEDRTPEILSQLCKQNERIRAIRLGRNCGSHAAYRAGLEFCTGDAVAFTVADLQEGIDLIRKALQAWSAGASVVGTVAIGRDRGGFINEAGARLFYWMRHRLGRLPSRDAAEAALRVIDRSVVEYCRQHAPRTRNINTWVFSQPFATRYLRYTPTQRRFGASRWTFRKKLQLVADTMIDASPVFMTVWLLIGFGLLGIGSISCGYEIAKPLWNGSAGTDRTSLLIGTIAVCTGLILSAVGAVGVYVWRIYEELRGGPGFFAKPVDYRLTRSHDSSPKQNQTANVGILQ